MESFVIICLNRRVHDCLIALVMIVGVSIPAWAQDRAAQLALKIDEYMTAAAGQAKLVAGLKNQSLDFPPGETYKYSNSGYYLLGVIIEHAAGVSYEAFVRDNIVAPLALTSTGYDSSRAIIKNRASGRGPVSLGPGALYRKTGLA